MHDEIKRIHERNKRVEGDKAWETSWARKGIIAAITYIIAIVFLLAINESYAMIKALIPSLGFLLSTLTMPFVKRMWLKKYHE